MIHMFKTKVQTCYHLSLYTVKPLQFASNTLLTPISSWVSRFNWQDYTANYRPPAWWQSQFPKGRCRYIIKTLCTTWDIGSLLIRTSLIPAVAEFWPPIVQSIPQIVALLQDSELDVRRASVDALSTLCTKCEIPETDQLASLMSIVSQILDGHWGGHSADCCPPPGQ